MCSTMLLWPPFSVSFYWLVCSSATGAVSRYPPGGSSLQLLSKKSSSFRYSLRNYQQITRTFSPPPLPPPPSSNPRKSGINTRAKIWDKYSPGLEVKITDIQGVKIPINLNPTNLKSKKKKTSSSQRRKTQESIVEISKNQCIMTKIGNKNPRNW